MKKTIMLGLLCCCTAFPAKAESLHIVFVSGSFEYESDKALDIFKDYLNRNFDVEITFLKASDWNVLTGLEALDTCDVALFYTRRLTLDGDDLKRIRAYVDAGRPLVALRTASHGFQKYLQFDTEVLGGNYDGHYGEGPTTEVGVTPWGREHPILHSVGPLRSRYSLYKTKPLADDTQTLMIGKTPLSEGWQPLAWVREHKGGRIFYTSLGGVGDFEGDSFKRLIANALFWAAKRDVVQKDLSRLDDRKVGDKHFTLELRSWQDGQGDLQGRETIQSQNLDTGKTAVLICDMWDKHWCEFASNRVDDMAGPMNEVIASARNAGLLIVHAPSETLGFYSEHAARRRIQGIPLAEVQEVKQVEEDPLPIDDSDGGCPDDDISYGAWTRQHPAIEIHDTDILSDNGREIFSYLQAQGIDTILYMGVHTNMCVLGRSFGIRQMTRWGMNCILVRDLTDTMYNPAMPPQVPHDTGTELVVRHIEKYWAPTLTSESLLAALSAGE